ncbi:type IV toxin-antitoxin system AbiEi family antitoxin domain-containing protein [Microlunatus sp. Gsoil 973]|uniref:type IV toxin-antitoxin system AbiEi family antitoxin domain-containing protein n=1 Tax=Microlunatus sp. Gsoil 973 TaxID=2672569 RepID=UPI0018A84B55|nr:type IV toxin-antitoxin system AbiEi family antitoxin domain-containing protein [Microlunatus sp. Gsoil 973]
MTNPGSSIFPAWHADPRLPTDRPFTAAQARHLGVDGNVLARLVRQGLLRRVLHGVYVDACVPDSIDERARALALAVPEAAVITDATAAWLYGVDLFPGGSMGPMPRVQYFRHPDHTRVRRKQVQGGRRMLDDADLVSIGPVLVTSPLRTACDLGRSLRREKALAGLDALLRLGGFTAAELDAQLRRFRGRRGVVQLRELVPLADGRAESVRESELRLLWIDAGLPKPDLQISVLHRPGREPFRLDLGDARVKYAAEYDGEEWHSTPEQIARDAWRRELIRGEGWTIDVFGNADLHRWSAMDRLKDGYRRAAERAERRAAGDRSDAEAAMRAFGLPRHADSFLMSSEVAGLVRDPYGLYGVSEVSRSDRS